MDSPVRIPFKSFIVLKPKEPTALYLQIVFEFIKAIQMGLLPEGTKLPGTRVLCKVLSVNRNTLIKAFQDLEMQGWIEILPNKGAFVLSRAKQGTRAETALSQQDTAKTTGFEFSRSAILEDPAEQSTLPYSFNDGLPDVRLLQTAAIARMYASNLKRYSASKSAQNNPAAIHTNFKLHFSNYLNLTRGLRISTSNLLTTGSHEISLYLVARVLLSPGDTVVIASPGYYRSTMTLLDAGAKILTVPADGNGIHTEQLGKICLENKIKALYLTSGYHYPTTVALSAKRRLEVLELATRHGFVIIEDDYDFDFHYDNNPVLPLAAFDNYKVVYIGSFGKSLPPGFGYGFVAAPPDFIAELQKHLKIMEHEADSIKERVITEWIKEGEVHRLSKKNIKLYKERRDCFVKLLKDKLKGRIKFKVPARGLAVWVEWQEAISLISLKKECEARGLFLPKVTLYQSKNIRATRLGFGHMSIEEMEKVTAILSLSLEALVKG